MKQHFLILIIFTAISLLGSCREEDSGKPETAVSGINCDTVSCPIPTDFYGAGLMNGECWFAEAAIFDRILTDGYLLQMGFVVNGISENIIFDLSRDVNLEDTIWLARGNVDDSRPNIGKAWYSYSEGHSIAGGFDFTKNAPPTYEDYLLIDYFNEDTTLLEGRFKLRFTDRSVNSFVTHAPDSMRFECGRFRLEQY
ncbi:MAG: hypothetical protein GVY26_00025 [Bacteroidetes bacterium]|jgi:hypothetical protein|nr:hypothetical protein [Bacteroidota bacterium]